MQMVRPQHMISIAPTRVEINGVDVPFTVVGEAGDTQTDLYDNVGAAAFAATTHPYRVLDDFAFAGSAVQITGLRPSWSTPAALTIPTTEAVIVEFQFFGTLNPAVTPVNSAPSSSNMRVTYPAPTGGWAVSSIYTGTAFVAHTGSLITASSGAVDVRILRAAATPHPDFGPAFDGAGPSIGTSNDVVWIDNNNDGIYQGQDAGAGNEASNFGGAPTLANLRLAIQGNVLGLIGACCLPDGSCVILDQASCVGLTGTYGGDGTTCSTIAHCSPTKLWDNGSLSTGTTSINGATAPAGTTWAEGPQTGSCSSNNNGFNCASVIGANTFRLADDFTVPANKQWALSSVTLFCYQTGTTSVTSPFNGVTLQIWNGVPGAAGSSVVFGDATTNLYGTATVSFSTIYRIFNSGLLGQAPGTTRPIWQFQIPVAATLPAGTYWLDWNISSVATGGNCFYPMVSLMTPPLANGVRDLPTANARQNVTGVWASCAENGAQAGCNAVFNELPFIVRGVESSTGSTCYANCDGSTTVPFLNVNDFVCFQGLFAAGNTLANCDHSTNPPVLNISDFVCFQGQFAAGCSAP
jgi:hypothetical protein